jgi:hypothetical protein
MLAIEFDFMYLKIVSSGGIFIFCIFDLRSLVVDLRELVEYIAALNESGIIY